MVRSDKSAQPVTSTASPVIVEYSDSDPDDPPPITFLSIVTKGVKGGGAFTRRTFFVDRQQ